MKRVIVWFKTDLRLLDNETLHQAISSSDEIIPIYCFDESQFKKTKFGTNKTGNFRAQFLLESLIDLDKNLRALGSGLIIITGKPEIEIVELAKKYNVKKIFAKSEAAFEELATQAKVEAELLKIDGYLETFNTSNLYHLNDMPFKVNDMPDMFTNFRRKVEKAVSIRNIFAKPIAINSPEIHEINLPSLQQLGLENTIIDYRAAQNFKGGETVAWKHLNHYFYETKSLSTYKETRNALMGTNYSSKFSAWLALGCISARSIYTQIQFYEKNIGVNESTYWLFFELLWRDFFSFMMTKYGNRFFQLNGIKSTETIVNNHNPELFEKWKYGQTGNDFIDANMMELNLTGFMSNRGRQNVGSYLCNNLNLDWRYGAAYFEQQLIDYDVCSNWGNWAYLAGFGNDPRGKRVFNIEKQANDYDKDYAFRNLWFKGI